MVIPLHLFIIVRNGLPVYKELRYLAEVKRFSMAVMFLSDKDKEGNQCTFIINCHRQLSNGPQVSMVNKLINHAGCW